MSDNAEYDQLVRDKSNAESRINQANAKKKELQGKIDRLKTAKRALGEDFSDFRGVKNAIKNDIDDQYQWKGYKYDRFRGYGESLNYYTKRYYERIDDARDAVNLEIARLENEIYKQNGLLGELHALVNSLAHRIENFFNG